LKIHTLVPKIEWACDSNQTLQPTNRFRLPDPIEMTRPTPPRRQTPATERRAVGAKSGKTAKTGVPAHSAEHASGHWTFLTNHSHVLILLAHDPSIILRKVAAMVGITERAVQRIIADLQGGGFIEREKVGRQNHYRIISERKLRHAVEAHRTVGDLLRIIDAPR
jgi:hypothetical protein